MATFLILSTLPTDVPPYFWTINAITYLTLLNYFPNQTFSLGHQTQDLSQAYNISVSQFTLKNSTDVRIQSRSPDNADGALSSVELLISPYLMNRHPVHIFGGFQHNLRQSWVGMYGLCYMLQLSASLYHYRHLAYQIRCMGPNYCCAKNPVCAFLGNYLHETLCLSHSKGLSACSIRESADTYLNPLCLRILFPESHACYLRVCEDASRHCRIIHPLLFAKCIFHCNYRACACNMRKKHLPGNIPNSIYPLHISLHLAVHLKPCLNTAVCHHNTFHVCLSIHLNACILKCLCNPPHNLLVLCRKDGREKLYYLYRTAEL